MVLENAFCQRLILLLKDGGSQHTSVKKIVVECVSVSWDQFCEFVHPLPFHIFCWNFSASYAMKCNIHSESLWWWYINTIIMFLNIIHVPFLFKIHNISETAFYLRLQVELIQLGPINSTGPYLWIMSRNTIIVVIFTVSGGTQSTVSSSGTATHNREVPGTGGGGGTNSTQAEGRGHLLRRSTRSKTTTGSCASSR
jgi:hypothetical protein